ncbi:MAG TPA: sugar ABC transporter ATP-binding protein, partial [Treponemataceae bacterium]|nr:sugar ABC transporter ATP-binding protein [Treponemataceae bacterium]
MQSEKVLEMQGICKTFPGVRALSNVNFTLRKGEVHALMGENGAGKSTLVKVMTGVYEKDAGHIAIEGKAVHFKSPQEAQNSGIGTVYQEITLCPNLTVAENMFIGRGKYAFVSWQRMNAKAAKLLESLSIPARPTQQLSSCSLAVQQMIAIARAIDMDCKILVLDEPTSSLDTDEVRKLFDLMRELKSRGVGIVFITHFLDQVYEISDRITVLRNGELIGEYEAASLPQFDLVSKMMGKALDDVEGLKKREVAARDDVPVFEASALSSSEGVKPFDFAIRKGEVNGFTGLLGSGRSESVRAIYAADPVTGGEIKINGKKVKIDEPIDAMRQGIGYLPEDRKGDGIIADLSV